MLKSGGSVLGGRGHISLLLIRPPFRCPWPRLSIHLTAVWDWSPASGGTTPRTTTGKSVKKLLRLIKIQFQISSHSHCLRTSSTDSKLMSTGSNSRQLDCIKHKYLKLHQKLHCFDSLWGHVPLHGKLYYTETCSLKVSECQAVTVACVWWTYLKALREQGEYADPAHWDTSTWTSPGLVDEEDHTTHTQQEARSSRGRSRPSTHTTDKSFTNQTNHIRNEPQPC